MRGLEKHKRFAMRVCINKNGNAYISSSINYRSDGILLVEGFRTQRILIEMYERELLRAKECDAVP